MQLKLFGGCNHEKDKYVMIWGHRRIQGYILVIYDQNATVCLKHQREILYFSVFFLSSNTCAWGYENIAETYLTKPPWECEGKERGDEESNNVSFCHNFRFNLGPWLSQHDDCHFSLLFFTWWRQYFVVYIVEVSLVLRLYGIFSEILSRQTEKGWI